MNEKTGNSIANASSGERVADEASIKLPLRLGWRRETVVKEIIGSGSSSSGSGSGSGGVRGDVIYYAPCGKKLRNFQEIERVSAFTAQL